MSIHNQSWPSIGTMSHEGKFRRGELSRLIECFQQAGLTAIHFGGELLEEALENPDKAKTMGQQLQAGGITVVGLAGYRNLTSTNEEQRQAHITFLKQCLATAPLLGTKVVATETGTRSTISEWAASPDNQSPEAWSILCDTLRQVLPVAEEHGSVLALEGYVNNVINTQERMLALLAQFPTPHLQLVLDPFNYLSKSLIPSREQVVTQFLHRFKDRFVIAHLKDVSPEGAEVDTPEFGHGVFPHHIYLEFLRNERPDLPIILEHLPWDHLPNAIALLHDKLAS